MTTTTAKPRDMSIGAGLLIIAAVAALALGGGHVGSRGGSGGTGWHDPCQGKPASTSLGTVTAPDGKTFELRCGSKNGKVGGWRHMRAKHIADRTTVRDVLACIENAMKHGTERETGTTDIYTWQWGGHAARVYVDPWKGVIRNAFAGAEWGWAKCAGR